jgi:hypothetical protein
MHMHINAENERLGDDVAAVPGYTQQRSGKLHCQL